MNLRVTSGIFRVAVIVAVLLHCVDLATAQPLAIAPIGKFDLGSGAPTGLSGLTRAGGSQYYAVEDSGARMYPLTIDVDLATGAINSATVGSLIQLGGTDLEGIAYSVIDDSVYVSDETGPGIRHYDLAGVQLAAVTVPSVYDDIRANLSLESLSLQAGHRSLWTANEQALTVDGGTSTTSAGTLVRLQQFSGDLNPIGQWAYLTDSIDNSFPSAASEQVGVSDILVLPNSKLLVLERQADANFLSLRYKNRIYEVDFTGATDVSEFAGLSGGGFTPVSKTLLWDSPWFDEGDRDNFEGMTLGAQLTNGDFSVLLISDGDPSGGFAHGKSLYALRISGNVGIPGDFDFDGDVDGVDFLHWQRDLGDAPNLAIWEANFGTAATALTATTAVPEPAAAMLLVLAMAGMAGLVSKKGPRLWG